MSSADKQTLYQGKYLNLSQQGSWEYAERANAGGCVGILAITADHRIVLVEQFRLPVNQPVIEITAGLFGDEEEFADESLTECANRELIEETGYSASRITHLLSSPTSAGLSNETVHLFLATNLTKVAEGGGVDSEDITIHEVPLDQLNDWCDDQISKGKLIDSKIFSCLFLAEQRSLFSRD